MQWVTSRQSLAESRNHVRLTWLATVFIPLTFVTGFFSMNEDLGALSGISKTYFEAAVPIAVGSLLIALRGRDFVLGYAWMVTNPPSYVVKRIWADTLYLSRRMIRDEHRQRLEDLNEDVS